MRHLVEPVIGTVDVPSRSLVKTPFKIRPMVTVFEEGPIINYHNQYFNCKVNDKIKYYQFNTIVNCQSHHTG